MCLEGASLWVRLYTEIRHDRKLRRLSPAQRWLWVTILTMAKDSPSPGWLLLSENVPVIAEDLADEAAIDIDDVKEGIKAFIQQNMLEEVDGVLHLVNWDKRQFVSDSSTERVKRYRQRQTHADTDNNETLHKRYSNVPETPPENRDRVQSTDTETEKEREAPPQPQPPNDTFPDHTPTERECLSVLKTVPNYPFDFKKDLEYLRNLMTDYPLADPLEEVKKWRTYKLDKPLHNKSSPRSQLRNWFAKAEEFRRKRGDSPYAKSRGDPNDKFKNDKYAEFFV